VATNREIKEALGLRPGAAGRQVENSAIRAWCVGGDDLLDGMELVNRLAFRLRERGIAGVEDAELSLSHLRVVRDLMLVHVRSISVSSEI
jgi:hypothetical protein